MNVDRSRAGLLALCSVFAGCDACDDQGVVGKTFALCVEPADVDFGRQQVRTDGSRTLVVVNCGGAALDGLDARVAAVDDDVEAADAFTPLPTDVESPFVPGAQFLLPVRFRPAAARAHRAALVFELPSRDDELLDTVALSGEGVPSEECDLRASPSPAVFPTTLVGESSSLDVLLTNEGEGPCALGGARIVGGHADFALATPPADDVEPGASTTATIAFAPTVEGDRTGRFAVVVDGAVETTVDLTGPGQANDACRLVADPAVLALPRARVGAPATEALLVIGSVGELDCTLTSATVTTGADAFSVASPPPAGTVLAAGDDVALTVRFAPPTAGDDDGVLRLTTAEGTVLDVPLAAFGDPAPTCGLRFDPTPLSFGDLAVGLSVERDVRIVNASDVACTVTGAHLDPLAATDYAIVTPPTAGLMAPGDENTARVRFTPSDAAPALGALLIDVQDASPSELPLVGFGGFARLVLTPSLQGFGTVTEGCVSRTHELTLSNVGAVAARIDAIGPTSASDPNFQILSAPDAGTMLAPSTSSPIALRMASAPGPGPSSGTLVVRSTGAVDAIARAALFGATASEADAQRVDQFVQREQPAVDILFVVDDSGSMAEEQQNVAANFQAFIQFTAGLGIDYHIGIVTTDTSNGGELVAPYIANTGPDATADPVAAFVSAVNVGTSGSASERGLQSARLALTSPAVDGANAGFLRDDALLSIIFVSDEEDQSTGDVAEYVDAYVAAKDYDADAVIASAVAGDVPLGCDGAGGSATAGTRYFDVAATLGGVFASICTTDWAATMAELGLSTFDALTRFELSRLPDEATIVVTVDGQPVDQDAINGWTYDADTNSIRFHGTAVPDAGEVVSVAYTAECIAP